MDIDLIFHREYLTLCRYLMKHETTHTGERFKAAKCRFCAK